MDFVLAWLVGIFAVMILQICWAILKNVIVFSDKITKE
jgi:hypothetical protein